MRSPWGASSPPEAVSLVTTGLPVSQSILCLPFSDPDVSFVRTWPRCCHTCVILTVPLLSAIQTIPCYSSFLHPHLFTSLTQTKYHPPLFIKVAKGARLLRSFRSYKNTECMALVIFSEEPSPEDSETNQEEHHWQEIQVTHNQF